MSPTRVSTSPRTALRPPEPREESRLPVQLSTFVGRGAEIEAATSLLTEARLVTLTGAGGSGKTRLAHEVAKRFEAVGREVAWVELAPVKSEDVVPEVVLAAAGIKEQTGRAAIDLLHEILHDRGLLIVLDNCEHQAEAAAALAEALLRGCPALRILATSRQALAVEGEVAWLVPPMSLPTAPERLSESEAVQLFVERARAVAPGFALNERNTHAVAEICRRLDGLPLALELAAARLRVLGPEQIASRLTDRFRLLTSGSRSAVPRHQTLRAAIDWSYELLSARERLLLERAAFFEGTFSLEAAETVCAAGEIRPDDVLDLLAALVDKSLVEMVENSGTARYRLLETVRQYAVERLADRGEVNQVATLHAAFFTTLAVEGDPHLMTPRRREWMGRLEPELDNFRQALAWLATADPARQMRLAGYLRWFWFSSGLWVEGRRWLEASLAHPSNAAPTHDRAMALYGVGMLAALQARGDVAVPVLGEALPIARSFDDARLGAYILNYTGFAHAVTGAPELAEQFVQRAAEWFSANGDLYGLRLAYMITATVRVQQGRIDDAVDVSEKALAVAREFGQARELSIAQQMHGFALLAKGEFPRAARCFRESLESSVLDPQPLFISRSMEMLAATLVELGRLEDAARIFGAGEAVRDKIGAQRYPLDRKLLEPRIARARERLGEAAYEAGWRSGHEMSTEAALDDALETTSGLLDERDDAVDTAPEAAAVTGASLVVRALGSLEIVMDGSPLPPERWKYTKPRELLLALLSFPEGRTREQIGLMLWPDASAPQVRNNFHVTLHHLRKVLGGGDWVRFERNRYRLTSQHATSFDAAEFESLATAALRLARRGSPVQDQLRAALAMYRGNFAEGEPFGDWAVELRERLARIHCEAAEKLAGILLESGSAAEAVEIARRLVAADPLAEGAVRILMQAMAGTGDTAGALRAYRDLERRLDSEVGARPSRETQQLIERLID